MICSPFLHFISMNRYDINNSQIDYMNFIDKIKDCYLSDKSIDELCNKTDNLPLLCKSIRFIVNKMVNKNNNENHKFYIWIDDVFTVDSYNISKLDPEILLYLDEEIITEIEQSDLALIGIDIIVIPKKIPISIGQMKRIE